MEWDAFRLASRRGIIVFPVLSGNCLLQEWQDERLTWNPADFGNVTDIIVRADKLWLPELAVMNGFVLTSSFHYRTTISL